MANSQTETEDQGAATVSGEAIVGTARKANRLNVIALPLILLLALIIRLAALSRNSLFFDELYNLMVDRLPLVDLLKEAVAAGHPPLYYLLSKFWYLFGTGVFWARLLSVVGGMAVVLLSYAAAREIFSRRVALWTAALVAVSPMLFWYSRSIIYYSWVTPLAMLSFYMLARCARRGGGANWVGYYLATLAVFLTYFYAVAMLAGQWAAYWLLRNRQKSRASSWLICQAALVPAVAGSYLLSRLAISTSAGDLVIPTKHQLGELIRGLVVSPAVILGGEQVDGAAGGYFYWRRLAIVMALIIALLILILAVPSLRRLFVNRRTGAVAAFLIAITALPLIFQSITMGTMSGRFYVWAAPVLLMLFAVILAAAPWRFGLIAGLVVMAGLFGMSANEYGRHVDTDWRAIMATIDEHEQPGDQLFCLNIHNCVMAADYYLKEPLPVKGGFLSDPGKIFFLPPGEQWTGYASGYWAGTGKTPALSGPALAARVNQDTSSAQRLWLVTVLLRPDELCSKYPELCSTIDSSWRKVEQWDFSNATLELFERR